MIVNALNLTGVKYKSLGHMRAWTNAVIAAINSGCRTQAEIIAACDKMIAERKLRASASGTGTEVRSTTRRLHKLGRLERVLGRYTVARAK